MALAACWSPPSRSPCQLPATGRRREARRSGTCVHGLIALRQRAQHRRPCRALEPTYLDARRVCSPYIVSAVRRWCLCAQRFARQPSLTVKRPGRRPANADQVAARNIQKQSDESFLKQSTLFAADSGGVRGMGVAGTQQRHPRLRAGLLSCVTIILTPEFNGLEASVKFMGVEK